MGEKSKSSRARGSEEDADLFLRTKKKVHKQKEIYSDEASLAPWEEEWMGDESVPKKTYVQTLVQGEDGIDLEDEEEDVCAGVW